jgi:hypothetical protein
VNAAVVAIEDDLEVVVVFGDVEVGVVVEAGEEAAAGGDVEAGGAIAAGDVDAFVGAAVFFPLDGETVGGVFGGDAGEGGEATRPDFFEADEADAGDGVAVDEFRPEGGRQVFL